MPYPNYLPPKTHQHTPHLHFQSASPGQSKVGVGLLTMGGRRVFQCLQERREGTLTRGRHVGHPEARTGRGENPVTKGTRRAMAHRDSALQTPTPAPGFIAPPITSTLLAPGALTQDPNFLRPATRIQAHAALRPRPSPATTFPGSFQQGEETGVGREKPGERGIWPRGGRGGARSKAPCSLAL